MARFYASIQGGRGEATRMGNASSGIYGHIRGWTAGVEVYGFAAETGEDVFHIYMTTGSTPTKAPVCIGTVRSADGGNGETTFTPSTRS